jgi:regulator of nucleoside diphosphate kinase
VTSKPHVIISSVDLERIEALLEELPANAFPGRAALEAELGRAEIREPNDMPPSVVTMNSTVRFAMLPNGEAFQLSLVYPKDVDGSSDRISILAPVGSALLGLAAGEEIEWPAPGGGAVRVKILDVVYQPERAGEFHR